MIRKTLIAASTALLLGPALYAPAQAVESKESYRLLELFVDVFERVRSDYVEPVKEEDLIEAALNGMLSSLDPHSSYLNPKNAKELETTTKGEFGGLGLEVTMDGGLVKVVTPIDDTPAYRAGLQPGDLISHLNGEPVQGLSLSEAVDRMRGAPNTDIRVTVRRGNQAPFEVKLTRAVIHIRTVRSATHGTIGYLRITQFSATTTSDLNKHLDQLKAQLGAGMTGLVLDLRNNPGGLLTEAVSVSDAFLERGEIVSTRGRKADKIERYSARPGDVVNGLPMVVLINDGSASASEIVAGALQDHKRAVVLGTKSFGKGSVQTVMNLPGGHGSLRLTTAKYFTPSGRSIQAVGIEPDMVVQPSKVEPIGAKPRPVRSEASLPHALANPNQAKDGAKPGTPAPASAPDDSKLPAPGEFDVEPTAQPIKMGDPATDYQLARALDLLRGHTLFKPSDKAEKTDKSDKKADKKAGK